MAEIFGLNRSSKEAKPTLPLLHSLEIETYIDLNTPKLALRFALDQGKPQPPVPAAAERPVRAPDAKWSMEDTEWDATAWQCI
ncbi:hypothetical protein DFH09DRAFT_1343307 [Mycena vulgaris]|nr:hypothetical protein DFH09DRAFT_1343307 [Mycena vulgaris]